MSYISVDVVKAITQDQLENPMSADIAKKYLQSY